MNWRVTTNGWRCPGFGGLALKQDFQSSYFVRLRSKKLAHKNKNEEGAARFDFGCPPPRIYTFEEVVTVISCRMHEVNQIQIDSGPPAISMSLIIWISLLLGSIGAGIYYAPYLGLNVATEWTCPLCLNITSVAGTPFTRFLKFVAAGGLENSALLIIVGLLGRLIANEWFPRANKG